VQGHGVGDVDHADLGAEDADLPALALEMPQSMRPGASAFREASALAATGAMRLEGISTPVARRMREVCTAAAPMATNMSALSICVS
jgi:hypothetical protein